MTSLKAIRDGLVANLNHLNDDAKWIQVSAYALASPTPPTVQLMPSRVDYGVANSRGGDCVYFTVQAMVVNNFDQSGQMKLDQLLADSGPLSMKTVLESDLTLGGVVDDLWVKDSTGYQVYALAGRGAVLGADWNVEVLLKSV